MQNIITNPSGEISRGGGHRGSIYLFSSNGQQERYNSLGLLGDGSNGYIRRFVSHNNLNRHIAIKSYKSSSIISPSVKKEIISKYLTQECEFSESSDKHLFSEVINEYIALKRFVIKEYVIYQTIYPEYSFHMIDMESGEFRLIMPIFPGKSFNLAIKEAGSAHEREKIVLAVAKKLEEMHKKGILHGDVKPENILVHEEDGRYEAFIIDFGCSYLIESDKAPSYEDPYISHIAPELRSGFINTPDERQDVYSFAYMLLTEMSCAGHKFPLNILIWMFKALDEDQRARPGIPELTNLLKNKEISQESDLKHVVTNKLSLNDMQQQLLVVGIVLMGSDKALTIDELELAFDHYYTQALQVCEQNKLELSSYLINQFVAELRNKQSLNKLSLSGMTLFAKRKMNIQESASQLINKLFSRGS